LIEIVPLANEKSKDFQRTGAGSPVMTDNFPALGPILIPITEGAIALDKQKKDEHQPNVAPSTDTHGSLEENATEEEIDRGDYTKVTRLYLDRTPED
jgi:hypothetical protein